MIPQSQKKVENAIAPLRRRAHRDCRHQQCGRPKGKPRRFRFTSAMRPLLPVAFMDFTSVYRNHVTNGSIGTNFGNIPYTSATAYAPNLSEFRLSSENSRIGLRVDADVKGAHVMGYMEADFHGNNVTNVADCHQQ